MAQARIEVLHFELSDEVSREASTWFSWERRIATLNTLGRSQWLVW
jgi:hypothetical protein